MYHSDSELYCKSTCLFTKGKGYFNHDIKPHRRFLNDSYLSDSSDIVKKFNNFSRSSNSDSKNTPTSRCDDVSLFSGRKNSKKVLHPVKSDPDCCLFVASLMSSKTENELAESVSRHFNQWGRLVDVKVMKDSMNRPYGFIQYDIRENAETALKESANTVIDGRHIRVEKARVNRTIFLYQLSNMQTIGQIVNMVSHFGELEDVKILNTSDIENKSCGFFKFKYREDAIKAFTHYRSRPSFGVEWATFLEKTPRIFDFTSVFIGNLPSNITQDDLEQRFRAYGEIDYIHIFRRGITAFSLIKFKDYTMSVKAIEAQSGTCIEGNNIKIFFRKVNYKHQYNTLNEQKKPPKYRYNPKPDSTQLNPYKIKRETVSRESTSNTSKDQTVNENQRIQGIKSDNSQFKSNSNRCNASSGPQSFQQPTRYNDKSKFHKNGKVCSYQRKNSGSRYRDYNNGNFSYNQSMMMHFTPYLNHTLTNTSQSVLGSPQTPLFYPPYSPYFSPAYPGNNSMANAQYTYSYTPILKQLPDGSYAPIVSYPTEYYNQQNSNIPSQYQIPPSPLMLPPPQIPRTSADTQYSNQYANNSQFSRESSATGMNVASILDNKSNTSDGNMNNARSIYDRKL